MDLTDALAYLRPRRNGVLATVRRDGRPQLSNISYYVTSDDLIAISITATRAKYANARRDPRVSMHVTAEDFWSYVVVDGAAELMEVTRDPHDATADAMVEYYRALRGEHPDWDEYRAAMVADQRLMLKIHPEHAYGMNLRA